MNKQCDCGLTWVTHTIWDCSECQSRGGLILYRKLPHSHFRWHALSCPHRGSTTANSELKTRRRERGAVQTRSTEPQSTGSWACLFMENKAPFIRTHKDLLLCGKATKNVLLPWCIVFNWKQYTFRHFNKWRASDGMLQIRMLKFQKH